MRVGIVHDWLTGMRGGERVLEAMLELYPDADLLTLVHAPGTVAPLIEARRIRTSFLQHVPGMRTRWRWGLPLFPSAIERIDTREYDLLLSSSHCVAKGIRPRPGAVHVSYCHTPMRYVWDQYDQYFGPGRASVPVRMAMRVLAPRLRAWDRRTNDRVNTFVANSAYIARRIRRVWNRAATVVHPPVDVDRFEPAAQREDFHLVVSALVPYKRVDVAVDAFRGSGRRLVIVGDGPEYRRLRERAGPEVTFAGRVGDEEVADLLSRCRTFVQTAEEDFGIAAVEAQAAGAPVVAYAEGGAGETVIDIDGTNSPPTGVLFPVRTTEGLLCAVSRAESFEFDVEALRAHARRFAPARFRDGFAAAVRTALEAAGDSAGREPAAALGEVLG